VGEARVTHARSAALFVAVAAFVAYLSFVPFHFRPLAVDEALARFARIPYLDLGAGSRADWVANILMFLPLGWLAAAVFVPAPRGRFDLWAIVPATALGAVWAVAVEFAQLYFPNRTVSINDIVAEVIGALLGAWLWCTFGASSLDWWRRLLRGGPATANAALAAYLLAYLVMSFSPFDVVIRFDELAEKAASNLYGAWLAPVGCGRTPCSLKLLAEALAVLPVGWWLATRSGGSRSLAVATLLGAGLGAVIEAGQFLLVSGTSQGASVVARALGVAAGAGLHAIRHRIVSIDWARWGRPLVLAGGLPWLAAVAYVAGWAGGRWIGVEAGLARLGGVQWMPFYYQYYSTEQALIRSTLLHLFLHAPVGVAAWLWGRRSGRVSAAAAALLAGGAAAVVETGKLFIAGRHPDYTDVLFAMASAWTIATVLRWASSAATRPGGAASETRPPLWRAARSVAPGAAAAEPGTRQPDLEADRAQRRLSRSWWRLLPGLLLLIVVLASLARFPLWQLPLAIGLAAYGVLLARWPLAYLWVLPAALPLLDLAPYSGRFFWDEFDLLVATTLGVRLLMAPGPAGAGPRLPAGALTLIGLSVLVSTAIALWPPAPLDDNAFTTYRSPYNALRIGRGYLWGACLLSLMWRDVGARRNVAGRLRLGLGVALLAAASSVLWERLLFVGLADFDAWFRAAGFVSATHVGGAYLEALLVALAPISLSLAVVARRRAVGVFWLGVTGLAAVALLLTLSRAAAAAWALALAAFALLWWVAQRRPAGRGSSHPGRVWGIVAVLIVLAGAGLPLAQSDALRQRLAVSEKDFAVRLAHWRTSIDLIEGGTLRRVFGMGLGSFPREFYLAQAMTMQLPAYRIERDASDGRRLLALAGGSEMYLDQRVAAAPGRTLRLRGAVRSARDGAGLSVALCEKSFLTAVRCDWAQVPAGDRWMPFELRLEMTEAQSGRFGLDPPVSLSLHNPRFGTQVQVRDLSLLDGSSELLANGSFDAALDRWLMHSDRHLAWRAHNSPLQVLFEQGILGLLAWAALAIAVVTRAVRDLRRICVAATAAALGFVLVSLFDTLLDAPRMIVLAAFIFWLIVDPPQGGHAGAEAEREGGRAGGGGERSA
jgi:VanZ family protein